MPCGCRRKQLTPCEVACRSGPRHHHRAVRVPMDRHHVQVGAACPAGSGRPSPLSITRDCPACRPACNWTWTSRFGCSTASCLIRRCVATSPPGMCLAILVAAVVNRVTGCRSVRWSCCAAASACWRTWSRRCSTSTKTHAAPYVVRHGTCGRCVVCAAPQSQCASPLQLLVSTVLLDVSESELCSVIDKTKLSPSEIHRVRLLDHGQDRMVSQ